MTEDVKAIKRKITPILKQAGISRSFLFGSYIRGEQKVNSDIDILVDFPDGLNLFDVAEIKYKLEDALGKKVDLVDYRRIKPLLKTNILANHLQIL